MTLRAQTFCFLLPLIFWICSDVLVGEDENHDANPQPILQCILQDFRKLTVTAKNTARTCKEVYYREKSQVKVVDHASDRLAGPMDAVQQYD